MQDNPNRSRDRNSVNGIFRLGPHPGVVKGGTLVNVGAAGRDGGREGGRARVIIRAQRRSAESAGRETVKIRASYRWTFHRVD